jgi:tRNA pseudouridine38-40 synthase
MDPEDKSTERNIIKSKTSEPFVLNGTEYIIISIYGNSFLYNQIRKMMGMIVSIMRGNCEENLFEKSFDKKIYIDIPIAPRKYHFFIKISNRIVFRYSKK